MQIELLSKRHHRGIRRLEKATYPPSFQLGKHLLDDVCQPLSCVVTHEGHIVGYLLTEVEDDEIYVADIVRSKESTMSATEMLMWLLGRLAERPEIKHVTAECRTTSIHLVERFGFEVVWRSETWCDARQESMTEFKIRLPER